ncbi:MAG: IS110 family transposase [Flavisolibacter sp.]
MKKKELTLPIIHPNAAGIDVGSRSHFVAIDQNAENVKEFGVYTKDHVLMIEHLRAGGVTSIAMESTGTYWQTLFNALQTAGFEVILVNGSQTKNVKGRKTDVLDCMWIQKLHSLGLLSGSFILSSYLQQLRTYYSHRQYLIEQTSKYTNKMQKALRIMNIRLDVVLNDIAGKSGMAIIDAILDGERDPYQLAGLVSYRVKKSKEEIASSLHGQWRPDLLFELKSCLSLYRTYENAIIECDRQIEASLLANLPVNEQPEPIPELTKISGKQQKKRSPTFNVQRVAVSYFKTDLYEIPGVSHTTILCLLTNMGTDLSKFASAKQFASWLRLVPNNKISGGRIISHKTPPGKNQIAHSLRQAANTIGNQKAHPLTPFFKRVAYRRGRIAAITATARKLAIIIWNMITKHQSYRHFDYEQINQRNKKQQLKNIQQRLVRLNLNTDELNLLFQKTSLLTT